MSEIFEECQKGSAREMILDILWIWKEIQKGSMGTLLLIY
jgi:hypothetical protein